MTALSTVTFLSALALVTAVPKDYIVRVSVECGKGAEEDAVIKVVTDLSVKAAGCVDCGRHDQVASARAVCAGQTNVDFESKDSVNYRLGVSYPGQGKKPCVFNKRLNAMVFAVKVVVAYGDHPGLVHTHEDDWTVTCTFDPNSNDKSSTNNVVEGCIAPAELLSNMGPESKSIFTLDLVDVVGDSFTGRDINLGRTVQLSGVAIARDGEMGIRPVSCYAIEGNASYAILRGGCGDGIVFSKSSGFTTTRQKTLSPYFGAFRINFQPAVLFRCKFVTCEKTCNGSSCETERKIRSLPDNHASKNTARSRSRRAGLLDILLNRK